MFHETFLTLSIFWFLTTFEWKFAAYRRKPVISFLFYVKGGKEWNLNGFKSCKSRNIFLRRTTNRKYLNVFHTFQSKSKHLIMEGNSKMELNLRETNFHICSLLIYSQPLWCGDFRFVFPFREKYIGKCTSSSSC